MESLLYLMIIMFGFGLMIGYYKLIMIERKLKLTQETLEEYKYALKGNTSYRDEETILE